MEDQISQKNEDSWSKDLAEIRSMLQELVATSKPTPMEFQRFCGENPELWISQAERYFDLYEIAENHKLSLASYYLDGAALTWYQWLFQNKQLADWEHFTVKVLIRFRKRHLKSSEGRLANLWQVPSVTEYPSLFEAISSGFSEPDILSPCLAHVHPQRRDTSSSPLPQNNDGQSEYPTKIDAHKVFDESSQTTVSSEINDIHSIIHKGENFATIVAKVHDNSFSEDISLQTKVPTAVLVDTKESNTEGENNPLDNVILLDKCPKQDISDSLVPFHSQGIVLSNVSMRNVVIKYLFDGVLWRHPIPCLHNSLEDMCGGEQTRVSPYIDFGLHKCNWVDTGQECNLPNFLSSNLVGCASEEKIEEVLMIIVVSSSKQSPYTQAIRLLFCLVRKVMLNSLYIVFDPGPYLDYEVFVLLLGKVVGIFCQRLHLDDELAPQRTDQQLASPHQAPRMIQHCYIGSIFVKNKFLQERSILQLVWILLLAEHKLRPSIITGSSLGSIICSLVASYSWTKLQRFIEDHLEYFFIEYEGGIPVKETHCYDVKVKISEIIGSTMFLYKIWERLMGNQLSATNIFLDSNLEDKVLIEDESIVMNQTWPNVDNYTDATQLVIGPRRSKKSGRPLERLIWDLGPINN